MQAKAQITYKSVTPTRPVVHRVGIQSPNLATPVRNTPLYTQRQQHRMEIVTRAGGIVEVDEETLELEVANRDRPLIIDFYATWCGPCLMMADELKKVKAEYGDAIKVLKLDTDKYPDISTALQIQGLPTLVFVGTDPNKPALRTEGLLPAQSIIEILKTEMGLGASDAAAN